jgi:hypothetical protein
MNCDAVDWPPVEVQVKSTTAMPLKVVWRLEGFQNLYGSLEADCGRLDVRSNRSLGHDRADEIVGQDVCPNCVADQLRRFSLQLI